MVYKEPLTRASRIMLPTYPVLGLLFGVIWMVDPQDRLTLAPALEFARMMFPVAVWGAFWTVLAAVMLYALYWPTRRSTRVAYMIALVINGIVWAIWGVVVEVAVFFEDSVSPIAGVLPVFVAVCCWASTVSLLWNERDLVH